jgi:hypothetical protein
MTHGDVHRHGGRVPVDIPVYPGFGWDYAEKVYYRALTEGFTGDPGLGTDAEPYFDKVRREVLLACEWAAPDGRESCAYKSARLAFYAVGLQPVGEAYGPDVMITPWGDVTHQLPEWQSPDIYVLDESGESAQPRVGQRNRLFVRVRNIGDQRADNVQVAVSYTPFGATYAPESFGFDHYKSIGTSERFNLDPGTERDVELDWDLTNLDEDHGGRWPAVDGVSGIRAYDHFCIRAEILCEGDVNNCNNVALTNYADVTLATEDDYSTPFFIPPPRAEPQFGQLILTQRVPRSWRVTVEGLSTEQLNLRPGQSMVGHLRVTLPPGKLLEPPIDGDLRGEFGQRELRARHIPLRKLGGFTARLTDTHFNRWCNSYTGHIRGTLNLSQRPFFGHVRGVVDRRSLVIRGRVEGFLLSDQWDRHEPFVARFEGQLTPLREVSLSLEIEGMRASGVTLRIRKAP